jgi:hypothetical protein
MIRCGHLTLNHTNFTANGTTRSGRERKNQISEVVQVILRCILTSHLLVEFLSVVDVLTVHGLALGRDKRGDRNHTKSVEVVSFCSFIAIWLGWS